MALVVEVQVEVPSWRKVWPRVVADTKRLLRQASADRRLVQQAFEAELSSRRGNEAAVAVVFADDAKLQDLNRRFRKKDKPTNVLSFPDGERPPNGGIALSFETIAAEAKAQNKSVINHAKHMILHGYLHLLGHDHEKSAERRLMEGLEIAILSDMGIPNPYLIETKRRG